LNNFTKIKEDTSHLWLNIKVKISITSML